MSIVLYDFEALRERFIEMSDREIMREYVMILAELRYIEKNLEEQEYLYYCESLDYARDFLGEYLARRACYKAGIYEAGF